jgi:mono/diheme cytochrome c family protein
LGWQGKEKMESRLKKMLFTNKKLYKDNNHINLSWGYLPVIFIALVFSACDKKSEQTQTEKGQAKTEAKSAVHLPSKGVGPIQSLTLGPIDDALVAKGEKIFSGTCSACHKMDTRYVGPALSGVTKRRTPEWIMNMILNPTEMTQKDDTAKALLATYMTQMSVNASEADARALLDFFRKHDGP